MPNTNIEMRTLTGWRAAEMPIHTVDSLTLSTIFSAFYHEFLLKLLEEMAKYILFPISAAASVLVAIFKWRQYYLDKDAEGNRKSSGLVRALIETGSAIAITAAVVGALVLTAIFATITPIIFAAVIGFKTLFNAGAAIYYGVTGNKEAAKAHAIGALGGGLAFAAVMTVMIFGKPLLAAFGIAAGVVGTIFSIVKGVQMFKEWRAQRVGYTQLKNESADIEPENSQNQRKSSSPRPTNGARFSQTDGATKSATSAPRNTPTIRTSAPFMTQSQTISATSSTNNTPKNTPTSGTPVPFRAQNNNHISFVGSWSIEGVGQKKIRTGEYSKSFGK